MAEHIRSCGYNVDCCGNPWDVTISVSPPIPTLTKRPPFAPAPDRKGRPSIGCPKLATREGTLPEERFMHPESREGGRKRRAQVSWRMEAEDCGPTKEGAKCGPLRSPAVEMATWLVKLPVGAVIDPAARLLLLRRQRGEKRPTQAVQSEHNKGRGRSAFSALLGGTSLSLRLVICPDVYLANGPRLIEAA
ncbi:hypothetical protein IscW_ISCW004995 [Ixodes scapularis]|uniref:Uncharacterized protein n=1 Tax=Ixodes scapularis TaxID=6945 RepID=B7PFW8_IXOSC|nr:hypothetical protein IscW_ISCW004995 [Ixodes scapularis]|eukprot:XP_002434090.1 hypothetical protein IscW_ISCW004995 [Ixodes scapularis]